jgi:phage tail-like protein
MATGNTNQTASDKKPFGAYHFTVEIDGENISYPFRSCSGLKIETAVVDLDEGGFNGTTRKLIGKTKYPNIVLKRGFCAANSELYKLKMRFMNDLPVDTGAGENGRRKDTGAVENGRRKVPNRISGVITQLGPSGSFMKFRFLNGIVCKWEGPDLDATKNEISIETIEIAHEGLELIGMREEK